MHCIASLRQKKVYCLRQHKMNYSTSILALIDTLKRTRGQGGGQKLTRALWYNECARVSGRKNKKNNLVHFCLLWRCFFSWKKQRTVGKFENSYERTILQRHQWIYRRQAKLPRALLILIILWYYKITWMMTTLHLKIY